MTLIARYIFRTTAGAFLAALFGLTGVIWITQALREVDLLTTKGQTLWIFFGITGLGIPILLMIIAPIALFIAMIYVLNRLNGDSELVVLSASGFSPWLLLRPFIVLSVLVSIAVASLTLVIMPWSFRMQKDLVTKVRTDFLTRIVEAGQFIPLTDGFLFHYRERGPNGELLGVFMQDRRDPAKIAVYLAEVGKTVDINGQNYLIMEKGSVQRQDSGSDDAAIVTFDRYAIDLSQFAPSSNALNFVPRERETQELVNADLTQPALAAQTGRIRAELQDRFINPLYALAFALIAFIGLGQARTTRQGRGAAIAISVAALIAVRIAGAAASTFMLRNSAGVILAYAVPLLTIGSATAYLLWAGRTRRVPSDLSLANGDNPA